MPPARLAARGRLALLIALVGLGAVSACGDDDESTPSATPGLELRDPASEATARVGRFAAAPDWAAFVELLAQPHAHARALLGPHRLRYTASLDTGPAGYEPGASLAPPAVGERIVERFRVNDRLELRWAAKPGEEPRLQIEQHNDHDHGRGLIVIGDQVWSQLDGRGWLAHPLESGLWELWTDDAQHAVLDLVELAGPAVEIDEIDEVEVGEREALRVTLRASEREHPERLVEAPTPWRRWADVELGAATIILDRATGLWLAAEIALRWSFRDSAGRELRGSARFDGRVEPVEAPPRVDPPREFVPLPERERPELLRQRMLGGLAGL